MVHLPPELWVEIFQLSSAHDHRTRIHISHVCRCWRQIILCIPSIWANLFFDDSPMPVLDIAHAFYLRSKTLPINVQIHLRGFPEDFDTTWMQLVRLITPRCRTMNIVMPSVCFLHTEMLLSSFSRHMLPALEELYIACDVRHTAADVVFHCPKLRTLTIPFLPILRSHSLTTLNLKFAHVSCDKFLITMNCHPTLESLTVDGQILWHDRDNLFQITRCELPRLIHLAVSDVSATTQLNLPGLTSFHLIPSSRMTRGFALGLCLRALLRVSNNPPLRTVTLHDVCMDDMGLPMLGAMPQIECLSFISCTVDASCPDTTCLFPNLSSLRFVQSKGLHDYMACAISARQLSFPILDVEVVD